ncbi:hypothetical protein [Tropheryma whipplei]|uniref:hypothetical protein n=1 Tax=Tropheryma whipplei TaxID=2039 RepID=UPI0004BA8A37|nr:hypothetical protein [Tropheryma whipplei]
MLLSNLRRVSDASGKGRNALRLFCPRGRFFRNTACIAPNLLKVSLITAFYCIEQIPCILLAFFRSLPDLPARTTHLLVNLLKVHATFVSLVKKIVDAPPRAITPSLVAVLLSFSFWLLFAFFGPLDPYQDKVAFLTGLVTLRLNGFAFIFLAIHIFLEIYLWLGLRVAYFRGYLLQYRSLRALALSATGLLWISLILWIALLVSSLITPPVIPARDVAMAVLLFVLGLRHFVITPLFSGRLVIKKRENPPKACLEADKTNAARS